VIKIIALLCHLSVPANCHEQIVTTSDFADISIRRSTGAVHHSGTAPVTFSNGEVHASLLTAAASPNVD
jgi:hypothetical protein